MTKFPSGPGDYQPSRRDVLRPAEYIGGAAIAAVFTGVVAFVATRDLTIALIGAGGVFIVVLVVLALLAMTVKPNAAEETELHDGSVPRSDEGPTDPHGDGDAPGEPGRRGH